MGTSIRLRQFIMFVWRSMNKFHHCFSTVTPSFSWGLGGYDFGHFLLPTHSFVPRFIICMRRHAVLYHVSSFACEDMQFCTTFHHLHTKTCSFVPHFIICTPRHAVLYHVSLFAHQDKQFFMRDISHFYFLKLANAVLSYFWSSDQIMILPFDWWTQK